MAAVVASYRDLDVWQKAMSLAERAYRLTRRFPDSERFGLQAQIQRSAVSVPSNIAEGHGRSITREYLHHLAIAHGSLMELETQLELARRLSYFSDEDAGAAMDASAEVGRMLHGLIRSLGQLLAERQPGRD